MILGTEDGTVPGMILGIIIISAGDTHIGADRIGTAHTGITHTGIIRTGAAAIHIRTNRSDRVHSVNDRITGAA